MNVSVEQLAESFKYAAPKASALGMEIEELNAWLGLLGNAGIQSSMAGTQMAFALGHMHKAFDKMEISGKGKSFSDMLRAINEEGWGAVEVTDAFAERGSRAVMTLRHMVPYYDEMLELQIKNKNAAEDLAEVIRGTVSAKIDMVKSLWGNLQIDVFEESTSSLARSIDDLYDSLSENRDVIKEGIETILGGAVLAIKLTTKLLAVLGEANKLKNTLGYSVFAGSTLGPILKMYNAISKMNAKPPEIISEKNLDVIEILKSKIADLKSEMAELSKVGIDIIGGAKYVAEIKKHQDMIDDIKMGSAKRLDADAIRRNHKRATLESALFKEKMRALSDYSNREQNALDRLSKAKAKIFDIEQSGSLKWVETEAGGKRAVLTGGMSIEEQQNRSVASIKKEIVNLEDERKKRADEIVKIEKGSLSRTLRLSRATEAIAKGAKGVSEAKEKESLAAKNAIDIAKGRVEIVEREISVIKELEDEKRKTIKSQEGKFRFEAFKRDANFQISHSSKMEKLSQDLFNMNQEHSRALIDEQLSSGKIAHTEALKQIEELYRKELANEIKLYEASIALKEKERSLIPEAEQSPIEDFKEQERKAKEILKKLKDMVEGKVSLFMSDFDEPEKALAFGIKHRKTMAKLDKQLSDNKMSFEKNYVNYLDRTGQISHSKATELQKKYYRAELEEAAEAYREKIKLRKAEWEAKPVGKRVSPMEAAEEILGMEKILKGIEDDIPKKMKIAFDESLEIVKDFKSTVESSLGGVFSDALKDELNSFEGYFSSFTDSLIAMWEQMAAKMVLNPTTATFGGIASGAASWGTMGAAGVALGGLSAIFERRERKKAEEKAKKRARKALNESIEDSIAMLSMSDIGYEIYQTTEKLNEMALSAYKTGASIEKLNELRSLETKRLKEEATEYYKQQMDEAAQPYTSIIDKYSGWKTGREQTDWSAGDWSEEARRLGDQLNELSIDNDEYFEVAEKQLDALMTIVELSEQQLTQYEDVQKSLSTQMWELEFGESTGTPDVEAYKDRYEELLGAAELKDSGGNFDLEAITEFQDFVSDWLDVLGTEGFDYNELSKTALEDLGKLEGQLDTPMEMLRQAIGENTGALSGSDGNTQAIKDLASTLVGQMKIDRDIAMHGAWVENYDKLGGVPFDAGGFSGSSSWKKEDVAKKETDYLAGVFPVTTYNEEKVTDSEKELMKAGQEWVGFAAELEGWFGSVDEDSLTKGQQQIVQEWREDFAKIPAIYDGASGTKDEQIASGREWIRFFKDIEDNTPLKELLTYQFPTGQSSSGGWGSGNSSQDYETLTPFEQSLRDFYEMDFDALKPHAKGGWSDKPGIFAETGYGEYAIPDMNNPNNEHYLKSVGADPTEIGKAAGEHVAKAIIPLLLREESSGGVFHIHVDVDGREIGNVVVEQSRVNPDLKKVFA